MTFCTYCAWGMASNLSCNALDFQMPHNPQCKEFHSSPPSAASSDGSLLWRWSSSLQIHLSRLCCPHQGRGQPSDMEKWVQGKQKSLILPERYLCEYQHNTISVCFAVPNAPSYSKLGDEFHKLGRGLRRAVLLNEELSRWLSNTCLHGAS